ncbi:DUF475 domain-containing protein [Methylogaea oryzae]|uniref:DUF475 domain-containing protein n=1 Tax=Methylogaea oryzae TaxID=1295382 RepID=UPI0006CF2651|nr:DUF475 domain-containing protein [Methylogaea oryzae]
MHYFKYSLIVTVTGLLLAWWWGGNVALFLAAILAVMEIGLSFDNAVMNAAVLRRMDAVWQRYFLTWGMVIAVFGMRLLFPIAIVAVVTGQSLAEVTLLALHDPGEYARRLTSTHVQISAFGGMYLMLVFFSFIFNDEKELHWLGWMERQLGRLGKLESIEVIMALVTLIVAQGFLPADDKLPALLAGLWGIILYVLVGSVSALFGSAQQLGKGAGAGFVSFIYLQLLDASFSFDGVIGAFAISKDIVIIMLGLSIGAMFVRSLTVMLVQKGTLDEYLFLEHGAHYAIGSLALIMLIGMVSHVSELATGLIGLGFILLSLWSSILYRRRNGNDA